MEGFDVRTLERPHPRLLTLYAIQSFGGLCAFPLVLVPLYFRYHTLRYRFDDEGVSASWGILFRREVYVTYRRIQDIHVSRNLFERWLGIGKVQIQTASGRSAAELTLEGMVAYDAVRDHLYRKMRGGTESGTPAAGAPAAPTSAQGDGAAAAPGGDDRDVVALLREIRDDLQATRRALEARREA